MVEQRKPSEVKILKYLGEGGYGSVYLIQHPKWGRIAFKKFSTSSYKDLERMKKEAEIHKNLHHPNILKMFDAQFDSEVNSGLFLEYMEYGPVDKFIQRFKVTWQWKLQILHDVALAMSYLHNHQPVIIHGDLKCQNILIGAGYHAKISDFGMADIANITQSGIGHPGCGTLEYIAPEYLKDPLRKKSEPFDVYGFGISVWEIFSQKHPYYDFSDRGVIQVSVTEKGMRPIVLDMGHNIPHEVTQLVEDCWQQEEQSRPTFHVVTEILSIQISKIKDDFKRVPERLPNDESSQSIEQIVEPTGQPGIMFNPAQTSHKYESQASITEFQRQQREVTNSNEISPPGSSAVCGKTVKEQVRASYTRLTNTLYPYPVLDKLFEQKFIEIDLLNEIRNINNKEKCCQKLLEELLKMEETASVIFKDVVKGEQPWLWNTIWVNPDDQVETSRPLNPMEQFNITQNIHCFRELLEPIQKCEVRFLDHLLKEKCITWSQFKTISDKETKEEKIEELFDTMMRRSFDHYLRFIECLKLTYQRNMAKILESHGIVLNVHISVKPSGIEKCLADIITKSANIEELGLTQSDKEIIKDILDQFEEKGIYIMGGSPTGSLIIFILCSTVDSLNELEKMFETGQLETDLFTLLSHMVEDNFKFDELIIDQTEFERGRNFFKFKFELLQEPQACDFMCVMPVDLLEMIMKQASRMIWVTLLIESFHTSSALQLIEYIKDGPDGFLRFVKKAASQIFRGLASVCKCWTIFVRKRRKSVKRSLVTQIIKTAFQRSWNILVDHMHVNDTLLEQLFEEGVLSSEEILECESMPTNDRNKQILNILKQKDFKHLHKFLLLLGRSCQQHLTNRIISFGVHWETFQDKWPLDKKRKLLIAANRDDLMKQIDLEKSFVFHAEYKKRSPDLISILLIGNCITVDQRNDLIKRRESAQKQLVLTLLENGSFDMYKICIEYFERTGQCEVVTLLQPNPEVQKYSHHIVNCLSRATDILNLLKQRIKFSLKDYSADSIQHTPFKSLNKFRSNETVANILESNQPDVYICFLNGILRTGQPEILLPMFQSIPHSNVLGNFESYLMETIDPKYELLLKLRDSHVINIEQMRIIDSKGTLQQRNKELLKIIFKSPPKYFNLFLTALSQTSGSNILGNLQLTYSDPSNPVEDNFIADEVVDISHEAESLETPELVEVESKVLSICGSDRTDDFQPMSQRGSGEKTLNTGKTLRSRKTFVSPLKNKSSQLTSVVIRNAASLPAEIQNILFLKRVAKAKGSSASEQNLSRHLFSILGYFAEISDVRYHTEILLSNYSAMENLTITIDQEEITKNRVKNVYEDVTRSIDPKGYILNKLYEHGVLTSEERTEIEALPDQMIRADKLLSMLFNAEHSKAFTVFRDSLLRDYSGIVQMIDRAHNLEQGLLTTTGNDPFTENTNNLAVTEFSEIAKKQLSYEYKILKQLGEGGYGSVYLIQHPTWGRVAFKKFSTLSSSDVDLERMKKEADIHKNLHHPNIVRMFDAQFDSEVCGLFLEYMEYGPVDEFLQKFKVTWQWKLQILHDVASAMSYLHHHQPIIIHGDLKSQNILIGHWYHAKIADFGMAQVKNSFLSRSGHYGSGSLKYIAPEYLRDPLKNKSEPSDVYGFAISAWEIFSEKRPNYDFYDSRLIKVFVAEKGMRPEISDMGDNIPQVVVKLIQDCWQQEETSRPTFSEVSGIIFDQLSLIGDDLRPPNERLIDEEYNISTEQIARSAEQPATISKYTPGSGIAQSSDTTPEIQACITGFRKVLTSLSTYLDSEYGLLTCLLFKGIITQAEYSLLEDFKSDTTKTYIELNDELLRKYINPKFESCCLMFCEALQENDQQHIVKYIMSAGENSDGEDRVLNQDEIAIIDNYMFCLVNLINPYRRYFLTFLHSKKCITIRHKEKLKKFPESSKKIVAEELLNIIKRRRYRDFCIFKNCLHDTLQHKLADILEKGGIVTVPVKLNNRNDKKVIESKVIQLITGDVDESDEIDKTLTPEQVDFIKEILRELKEFDIQLIKNSAWR